MTSISRNARWRQNALWSGTILALVVSGGPAFADPVRTFDSYHGFFVYGADAAPPVQLIAKNNALSMKAAFDDRGWNTTLYGPDAPAGDLLQALTDMLNTAAPDELLFFYYVGHGGGFHQFTQPDANRDESQAEDPIPLGFPPVDDIDETLQFGLGPANHVLDDSFGTYMDTIQRRSGHVSGVIEACHANGMLDGASDARGFPDKESVWMTSATEWECSAIGGPLSPLTRDLVATLPPANRLQTLGDLLNWYTATGVAGHREAQTYGVKTYEGVDGSKTFYPAVSEPSSLLLLGSGLAAIAGFVRKRFCRKNGR